MKDTIIFDLDGTLLDSLDDLKNAVNYTLNTFNLPTKSQDEIKAYLGNGMERLIELSTPFGKNTPHFDEILQSFKDYYAINSSIHTKPYPGIIEMLQSLKSLNYKLAIVSNKGDFAVKILNDKFFNNIIDVAIGEQNNLKKKPSPDMIYEVLRRFDKKITDAYYIGDSEVDIETASAVQIPCLSVSWGFRTKEQLLRDNASIIFDNPQELLEYIKKNSL